MVVLTVTVFSHLENEGIEPIFDPSDGAILFRQIGSLVLVVGASENLLRLFESDAPGADSPSATGSCADRSQTASV